MPAQNKSLDYFCSCMPRTGAACSVKHLVMLTGHIAAMTSVQHIRQCWLLRVLSLLQEGPGKYNDDVWEAMDRIIDEARRAGLKVMLSFLDNWKYTGASDSWDENLLCSSLPGK